MKALSILKKISVLLVVIFISASSSFAQTAKQTKVTETPTSSQKVITGSNQVELNVYSGRYEVKLLNSAGVQRKDLSAYSGVIGFMYSNGTSAEFDLVISGDKLVYTKKDSLKVSKVRMKISGGAEDIFAGFEIQ